MRYARNVVRFAVSMGATDSALLAAARIDPAAIDDLDAWVDAARMAALWEAAAAQTDDPDFGLHLGSRAGPGAISIVGYLMMSARTLGDALDALVRYYPLLALGRSAYLDEGGPGRPAAFAMRPALTGPLAAAVRQPFEAGMASFGKFTAVATGRRLPLLSVAFMHPRPATGTATHEAVFGVVPTFEAPAYRIEFEASALRWPGVSASEDLHAAFLREADLLLARLDADVRSRAASAIETRLQGAVPTLAEVAGDLALGERTLQRALDDKGTSFQKLVDEVRCDLAVRHLGDDDLTITEIGFRLGYSAPSAFHRAFKRWTGLTPSAYRAREQAA